MRELATAGRKGTGWGGDWTERKNALGIEVGKGRQGGVTATIRSVCRNHSDSLHALKKPLLLCPWANISVPPPPGSWSLEMERIPQ